MWVCPQLKSQREERERDRERSYIEESGPSVEGERDIGERESEEECEVNEEWAREERKKRQNMQ